MDIQKTLLISDLDGTLLSDDQKISKENKTAIDSYMEAGGLFTIATGRGYQLTKVALQGVDTNLPVVILNGSAVYDFKEDRYLWYTSVGEKAMGYIKNIIERFPHVGVEILHPTGIYIPNTNSVIDHHMSWGKLNPCYCKLEELPKEDWMKVLFACEPDRMDELVAYITENMREGAHWVRSSDVLFELLPEGVNKATGLDKLVELMDLNQDFIVAVGDYNNDNEMLEYADFGVATGNAQEATKKVAQYTSADNNHHAIADVIHKLNELL